jgi:hypothetical protein
MFEARRADVLNQCIWAPSPEHKFLGYIEVWWAADQSRNQSASSPGCSNDLTLFAD